MLKENGVTYLRYLILDERKCEPIILHPAKLTFKYKGHRKTVISISKLLPMSLP